MTKVSHVLEVKFAKKSLVLLLDSTQMPNSFCYSSTWRRLKNTQMRQKCVDLKSANDYKKYEHAWKSLGSMPYSLFGQLFRVLK